MLVKDFITEELPVLKSYDTSKYALALMDDYKLRHLPWVDDNLYRGLVSEKELLASPNLSLASGNFVFPPLSVREDASVYEVLKMITLHRLSLLPVVDADGGYRGAVTLDKLTDVLSELCHAGTTGSVLVLELASRDYSLADVARIVEANHAHILSSFSHTEPETGRLYLMIKIDLEDASPVIRSFERFDYTVLYHFMERGQVDELLQWRMAEVLRYMDI